MDPSPNPPAAPWAAAVAAVGMPAPTERGTKCALGGEGKGQFKKKIWKFNEDKPTMLVR